MGDPESNATPSAESRLAQSLVPSRLWIARWGVLLLLALAAASAYLTRHCLAVANTTIQADLKFNNEQFGYLYGAFSLGYLICQIPGGWLGQKLGARIALPLFATLWSAMTLLTALVTTLPALIITRFLFGLAQAGLVPNQARVLQDWIPPAGRGTASAVLTVAMSVGAVASLSLTSWLLERVHWRTIFHAYSVVGIAWAVLFFLLFRARPADVPWLQASALDSQDMSRATPSILPAPHRSLRFTQLLLSRNVWGLAAQALFKAAGYNLLVTFFPAVLEYAYDTPTEETGRLTSWSLIAVIAGSLLGGLIVDYVQLQTGSKYFSRSGVAFLTLTLTGLCMCGAAFAVTATSLSLLMAAASLFSGMAGSCPWAASIDIGGRNTAVVMGFMNSGSALAGILISPLVGRLVDTIKASDGNWSLVIWLHAAFYLVAGLCWLTVNPDQSLEPSGAHDAV